MYVSMRAGSLLRLVGVVAVVAAFVIGLLVAGQPAGGSPAPAPSAPSLTARAGPAGAVGAVPVCAGHAVTKG